MRLAGKTALVTGAGSGIGAACAITYAREGAQVVVVDINAKAAESTVEAIRVKGGDAAVFIADVADPRAVEAMIAFTLARYCKLDILHNNTATTPQGPAAVIEMDAWQRAFAVSVTAYWYASKCALPHMVERGRGVILNTASISGLVADNGMCAYNAAKGAVVNMTRSIAIDYGIKGIRCNAICPGIIYTPPYEHIEKAAPERIKTMAKSVPLGRFGQAQEIANYALFLVSDEASFVTGACAVADGGRTAYTGTPSPVGFDPSL